MFMTTIRQGKKRRMGYENRVQKKNPNTNNYTHAKKRRQRDLVRVYL